MVNRTPEADFKRFEKYIDAMEDIEFEYWYKFEASKKQRELANGLRQTLTDEEAEGIYP